MSRMLTLLGTFLLCIVFVCCAHGTVLAQGPSAQWLEGLVVRSLLAHEGMLLAGTAGGAGVYRSVNAGETWQDFGEGLSLRDVTAVARRGNDWLAATWGAGVYRRSALDASWIPVNQGLGSLYIWALAVSADSHVYALSPCSSVYHLAPGSSHWEETSRGLPLSESFPGLFLFVDRANRLFAGLGNTPATNTNVGIYRYDTAGSRWVPAADVGCLPAGTSVRAMAYGPDGELWVATSRGLYKWNRNGTCLELVQGTSGWNVTALKGNPGYGNGGLFVGRDTGEIHVLLGAPQRWQTFKRSDTTARVRDFAFLETEPWRVFMATNNGVYLHELSPVVLNAWSQPPASCVLQHEDMITYTVAYTNVTSVAMNSLVVQWMISDVMDVIHVDGGTWLEADRTAFWRVGLVPAGGAALLRLRARVNQPDLSGPTSLEVRGAQGVWMRQRDAWPTRTGTVNSNKVLTWLGAAPNRAHLPVLGALQYAP